MANHTNATGIYAIRHKESGKMVMFYNGKCAWSKSGHAKSAFALHMRVMFDEQTAYEVIELIEPFFRMEGLEK